MVPYAEDELLPISALQHLVFCERQCALIHVERLWVENRFTAEGAVLHRKAHEGKPETLDGERIARGLPLRSLELGLSGVADIVLYRPPEGAAGPLMAALRSATPDELSHWTITPVEYKRGRPKKNDSDRVQLAAQAMCLEEMHGVAIPAGALFYGQTRRRVAVPIDERLRGVVQRSAARFREIMENHLTPRAIREKKCDTCSLLEVCLPDAMGRRSARDFVRRQLASLATDSQESDDDGPQ
jgi:CRISPR-associated exonuclease Cas4